MDFRLTTKDELPKEYRSYRLLPHFHEKDIFLLIEPSSLNIIKNKYSYGLFEYAENIQNHHLISGTLGIKAVYDNILRITYNTRNKSEEGILEQFRSLLK